MVGSACQGIPSEASGFPCFSWPADFGYNRFVLWQVRSERRRPMLRLANAPLPGTTVDPRYPDTNGRFMGDTDYHSIAISGLREGLEDHFADVPDVYVATNLVWYYKRGDARCSRDPDVLIAKGVGKHRRRSFRSWEEGCVPRTLFEIASRRTWRRDLGNKREQYERLKVKEYFVFYPEG